MGNELGPTDPSEIMEFILDEKHEPFPFAKLIALLTLCAWMRWPDDQEVIEDAQITAAAAVFLHEQNKGRSPVIPLRIDRLARSVVIRQVTGSYVEAFPEYTHVMHLIAFFMHCPEDLSPSLNKAYFFIEEDGHLPDEQLTKGEIRELKRGRSALKIAWTEQAKAGPLLFAAALSENDHNISDYAPDDSEFFDEASQLVRDRNRLLNYFGMALWCQQKLIRLLGTTGARKIKFPQFPAAVKPIDPQFNTYDETQLKILSKYRAPQ
jgi:hypothetical protein